MVFKNRHDNRLVVMHNSRIKILKTSCCFYFFAVLFEGLIKVGSAAGVVITVNAFPLELAAFALISFLFQTKGLYDLRRKH